MSPRAVCAVCAPAPPTPPALVCSGSCAITSGNPQDLITNNPDSTVKYSAVSVGPIGFSEARLKLKRQGK